VLGVASSNLVHPTKNEALQIVGFEGFFYFNKFRSIKEGYSIDFIVSDLGKVRINLEFDELDDAHSASDIINSPCIYHTKTN
jgi:hypothetical protein